MANDLYEQRIYIASNCKVVFDDIKQRSEASYGAIIHEIIDHPSLFTSCFFSHEHRSLNVEAHNLVKHALTLDVGRHVLLDNPYDLTFIHINNVTS